MTQCVSVRAPSQAPSRTPSRARPLVLTLWFASAAFVIGCQSSLSTSQIDRRYGERMFRQERYEEAAAAFSSSTRHNPRDYRAHYYLGATHERLGRPNAAIKSYTLALDTQPLTLEGRADTPFRHRVIDTLAAAAANAPSPDLELDALETRSRQTGSADDALLLARAYAYRGDPDNALPAFDTARQRDPRSFEIAKAHALYVERLGQPDATREALVAAYRLNAHDAEVNEALRRVGQIPGPSLLERDQLARPQIPKGPIPRLMVGVEQPTGAAGRRSIPTTD